MDGDAVVLILIALAGSAVVAAAAVLLMRWLAARDEQADRDAT